MYLKNNAIYLVKNISLNYFINKKFKMLHIFVLNMDIMLLVLLHSFGKTASITDQNVDIVLELQAITFKIMTTSFLWKIFSTTFP